MTRPKNIPYPFSTTLVMGYIVLFIWLIMTAAPAFADARITSWDDLRPGGDIEFDDPIAQLSPEQLRDLRIIVRIRWLIAKGMRG